MEIRRAVAADSDEINKLLRQVLEVHHKARPDLFRTGAKKYTDEELRDIIEDDGKPIFAAVDNGVFKGYAFCVIKETVGDNILKDMKTLYIDDLCVDENCRGEGVGKRLYAFVKEYARSIGCYNVTLNVWGGNDGALAFYRAIGMKVQKTGMEEIL